MLQTATILLGITALGGLLMAGIRFATKTNPPAWLAMLHGLLAASGLTLLVYAVYMMSVPRLAILALLLLLAAATGGAVMSLVYKWHQRLLPAWLVIAHAITAATGFALLVVAAYGSSAA